MHKIFQNLANGFLFLGIFLSLNTYAYSQSSGPSISAYISLEIFRDENNCTQTFEGLKCQTLINNYIIWAKSPEYPFNDPASPIGYWTGDVFYVPGPGAGYPVAPASVYSGKYGFGGFSGPATLEYIDDYVSYFENIDIYMRSDFVDPVSGTISITSPIPPPVTQDIGNLTIAEELIDIELQPHPKHNGSCAGDPVYLHSGQFYYNCPDISIPGRNLDINLSHAYFSGLAFNGQFGPGWMMNYYMRLHEIESGDVVIVSGDGRKVTYGLNGATYSPPAGHFETLVKNGDNSWTVTMAHGNKYEFDPQGKIIAIKDRHNNAITLSYSANKEPFYGKSEFAQDPMTNVILGEDYQLLQLTDTNGRVLDFTYNALGLLDTVTDNVPGGGTRVISYAYDSQTNDLITITKPATTQFPSGVTKSFTYTDHKLETITDAKSQTFVTNHYDEEGRVESQDLGAGSFNFDYSVPGETTATDRKGFVTRHVFNTDGQEILTEKFTQGIHAANPPSFITEMDYNVDGLQTSIKYPKHNGIKFTYDDQNPDPRARGNLLEIRKKPDMLAADDNQIDLVTTITYESSYNFPKIITDPKGNVTTNTYDYEGSMATTTGNLEKIEQPTVALGIPTTIFAYNNNGQVRTMLDPNNILTEYDYFPSTGYLQKITQDKGGTDEATTEYTYDNYGNLDVVTDANGVGHETDYDYDALGWLNTVTNALGYVTNYFYDANGNVERLERQADAGATQWQITEFTYDTLNNLKTIEDPLDRVTTYNYDLSENLESIADADTTVTLDTQYVFDERDLLFTLTDAQNGVTTYDYDNNGNLAKITDANLNLTTYTYDLYDRLDTMTYADSTFVDYTYDENSNLDFVDLPGTHGTIDYGYDVLNRLLTVDYGSGTPDKSFDYDLGSRMTDADNSVAQNHFVYDNLNRVQTNTQTLGSTPYALSYQYDNTGNRTKVIYPSTKFVEYTYDLHNRLDLVKVGGNTLVDYDYDPLDRRDTKTFTLSPTPLATSYQFDIANQLSSITNTILPSTNISTYAYPVHDAVSNRKQMDFTLQAGTPVTTNYVYNDIYELTSVTGAQTHSYDYDLVGNREIADGVTYTPNNLNQYSQVGGNSLTYDNNGNLTFDGVNKNFTYDELNRLTTFSDGVTNASYAYDAFNRRVSKTVNGTTTYFVYDNDSVIAEYDGSGALQAEYVLGDNIDEVLTMNRNSTDYYYFYDGLGSVTEITDSSGTIQERYEYDVYGTPTMFDSTNTQIANSLIENPYMFTGRRFDEESGTYYYRRRNQDPNIGRFMQRDPIGMEDSTNLYQFVLNNPTNWIDPYGTDVWIEGYSEGEPWLHQSISVGDPSGKYTSYSFGWNYGNFSWEHGMVGVVYQDTYTGGKINENYYLKTTSLEDQEVMNYLDSMVGDNAAYVPLGSNCRDFSQGAFETIEKAGIGKKSKPQKKKKK